MNESQRRALERQADILRGKLRKAHEQYVHGATSLTAVQSIDKKLTEVLRRLHP
jgi:hypothetical protein